MELITHERAVEDVSTPSLRERLMRLNDKKEVAVEEKNEEKVGEQAALVDEPWISSPDSSVAIVAPTAEGEGYKFVTATTFTSSTNITVSETSGTPTTPPDYSFEVPSTAIVGSSTGGLIPVNVNYNAGVFELGVSAAAIGGVIPRTIVVGGTIGATPNASTLSAAIALLPVGPFPIDSPWTLLFCPGVYTGTDVVIPPNVNLVALEIGSVIINQAISMTDASANNGSTTYNGITLLNAIFAFNTTAKDVNSTYRIYLLNCRMPGGIMNVNMRPQVTGAPTVGYFRDHFEVVNFNITGGNLNCNSGMTTITNSNISGANFGMSTTPDGTIKRLQISSSTIGATSVAFTNNNFVSVRDTALGGSWTATGTNCTLLFTNCTVDSNAVIPSANPQWTLRCNNSSRAYMWGVDLPFSLQRVDSTHWTLNHPNLLLGTGTPGSVDRAFRLMLLDAPAQLLGGTLFVALPVSVVTPFDLITPGNPQGQVQFSQATGAGTIYTSVTSTVSELRLVNQISLISGNVAVDVSPPPYNGVKWYSK